MYAYIIQLRVMANVHMTMHTYMLKLSLTEAPVPLSDTQASIPLQLVASVNGTNASVSGIDASVSGSS